MLLEVTTRDHEVWRTRLEHRVQHSMHSMAHKPQSWHALTTLIASYADAPQWSASVPRIEVDTSTGGVEEWARPVLQMLQQIQDADE